MAKEIITYFKSVKDTKNPHYREVEYALDRIRQGHQLELIGKIRSTDDEAEQQVLKNMLPVICFAGRFSERKDNAMLSASGLAGLDFDKVPDDAALVARLKACPYLFATFRSPRVKRKAIFKIPPSIKMYRRYYRLLLDMFADFEPDPTCINESRACFESYDPDLFVNDDVIEMPEIEEDQIEKQQVDNLPEHEAEIPKVMLTPLNKIRTAQDGKKHYTVRSAGVLTGGLIAGGQVDETLALGLADAAIDAHPTILDYEKAKKTFKEAIEFGKNTPIYRSLAKKSEEKLKSAHPEASEGEMQQMLHLADKLNLNPHNGFIYPKKINGKTMLLVRIDCLRIVASRQTDYAGTSGAISMPDGTIHIRVFKWRGNHRYIAADHSAEPAQYGNLPLWRLNLVIEAGALRKAYPQLLCGLYIADEFHEKKEIKQ